MLKLLPLSLLVLPVPLEALFKPHSPVESHLGQETGRLDSEDEAFKAEFFELLGHYENAFEGYKHDLMRAEQRGAPESEWPEHPSVTFYDRFLALAERGSAWGMAWLLENVQFRHSAREDQIRENKRWHEALFRGFPDHDSLLRATRLMPAAAEALGQAYVIEMLSELHEKTTRRDVKGNTLWALGTTLNGAEASEEDRASAEGLFEQLVQTYPDSPLARDAAIHLFPRLQQDLQADLVAWMQALQQVGTSAEAQANWPECPLEKNAERMKPLAQTGILQARHWYEEFYPRWKKSLEVGEGPAMLTLSDQCGVFQGAVTGVWADLMIGLRSIAVARWTGEDWLQSDIPPFVKRCFHRPYSAQTLALYFETLQTVASTPTEREAGALGRAFLLARGETQDELVAAHGAYGAFLAEFAESDWSELVTREHRSLGAVLPGALLELSGRGPQGEELDVASLRGSLVLIDFYSFNSDRCDERIRLQAEQLEAWGDDEVVLLGVCVDSLVGPSFTRRAEEHGLTWPSISDLAVRTQLASRWHVRFFPTSMVLDREGRIVTRNGSWAETLAVLETLRGD